MGALFDNVTSIKDRQSFLIMAIDITIVTQPLYRLNH